MTQSAIAPPDSRRRRQECWQNTDIIFQRNIVSPRKLSKVLITRPAEHEQIADTRKLQFAPFGRVTIEDDARAARI